MIGSYKPGAIASFFGLDKPGDSRDGAQEGVNNASSDSSEKKNNESKKKDKKKAKKGEKVVEEPASWADIAPKSLLAGIFEDNDRFAREIKPVEFTKKRVKEYDERDDEEKAEDEERQRRKLAKKEKRKERRPKNAEEGGKHGLESGKDQEDGDKKEKAESGNKNEQKEKQSRKRPQEQQSDDKEEIDEEDGDGVEDSNTGSNVIDKSKEERTIFIGNIPKSETVKSVTKFCTEFGAVESVRLRSVPVAGTAVDDAGNHDLMKKVCVNQGKLGDQKGSFNAYVVFSDKSSVAAALKANNRLMGKRHIRVDTSQPTPFDYKRTVFLGSLPHYADEEDVRNHFAKVLPMGQDDIDGIRIIRDPETLVGKGIGYLMLKDRDGVMQALTLHEQLFKKRALRVTICGKRTKRSHTPNTNRESDKEKDGSGGNSPSNKRARFNDRKKDGAAKGPESVGPHTLNAISAQKRLKLKTAMTKNKKLIEKGQKKKEKGRKGKRLGGVVKRAMKAAKNAGKMK